MSQSVKERHTGHPAVVDLKSGVTGACEPCNRGISTSEYDCQGLQHIGVSWCNETASDQKARTVTPNEMIPVRLENTRKSWSSGDPT